VIRLGIPDRIVEHGSQPQLWAECGFDADGIQKAVEKALSSKQGSKTNIAG
jgi:1-deoxy-D-xylulose-5-phosphate synthase